jgi:hypothetical protein
LSDRENSMAALRAPWPALEPGARSPRRIRSRGIDNLHQGGIGSHQHTVRIVQAGYA